MPSAGKNRDTVCFPSTNHTLPHQRMATPSLTRAPWSTIVRTELSSTKYLQCRISRHTKLATEVRVRRTVNFGQGDGWILLCQSCSSFLILRSQSLTVATPAVEEDEEEGRSISHQNTYTRWRCVHSPLWPSTARDLLPPATYHGA